VKLRFILLLLAVSFLFVAHARADDTVMIVPVDASAVNTCLPVPANFKSIDLVQVDHRGPDESVGFTRQGETSEKIFAATDVKAVVRQSITSTLEKCGYKIGKAGDALRLTVSIDEFFGGARNKFLIGKGTTKIALDLELTTPDGNSHDTFRFTNENDLKGFSNKKLTRLSKSLNGILLDAMKQIASSPALLNGVKDFSQL
jgi:uncharacterized lipoprotein YajG